MLLNIKIFKICIMHEFPPPKGQNMQTCTEKVSIFGVDKSWNEYLQSLRSVTILYKNMYLHGNPGSSHDLSLGAGTERCMVETQTSVSITVADNQHESGQG